MRRQDILDLDADIAQIEAKGVMRRHDQPNAELRVRRRHAQIGMLEMNDAAPAGAGWRLGNEWRAIVLKALFPRIL